MSRVQTSRANRYGPVSVAGKRQQQSFLGRMVSNTVAAFSTATATVLGKIIIGPTPPSIYDRLIKEELSALPANDTSETLRQMPESGDGQVTILRSKATGKKFARKITHPQLLCPLNKSPWDHGTWKTPNEVHALEASRLIDHPHPRILSSTVLDDNDHPASKVLWSSFCEGGNLAEQIDFWRVRRRTEIPYQFFMHILVQSFEALAYLHYGLRYAGGGKYYQDEGHRRIVHGDMKGENIFLRWDPKTNIGGMPDLVIGDFGVSLVEGSSLGAKVMAGTLCYNAPEIHAIYGDAPFDEYHAHLFLQAGSAKTRQTDTYAIGILLYMIASKDLDPWDHRKDLSELRISRDYEIPGLREFIVKCLQPNPSNRATADYDERTGVMHAVDKFRDYRDSLIAQKAPLGPTDWLQPNPVRGCMAGDGICKCISCSRAKEPIHETLQESRNDSFLDAQVDPIQQSAPRAVASHRSSLSSIDYREEN